MSTRRASKKSQFNSANEASNEEQSHLANEASNEEQSHLNESFPVVGIGASAGGLEAFTQLLSHLPNDTGMAFVIIQHLDPNQKSLLSIILSRTTEMPVREAHDGMAVEPNHVYVIPPNAKMTIAQGQLKLEPREKTRMLSMTVDAFFCSLAQERKNKAIGVVLSGGDADGARGLEEIKAVGGITFAQTQATAKVISMPNTAVATGQVDFILTPQAIAEELANISRHPYVTHPLPTQLVEEQPEGEVAMHAIFGLLRIATGVDFTQYKQTTLKRRVLRRMALYKLEQLGTYLHYIQHNPAEVTALYQDVLIHVTSFFRDSEAFEALNINVFPTIVKDKSLGSPIRVWVAGCSTGEEAYSIAICLLEFLTDQPIKPPIQIYATDVSEQVIEKARIGIYKHSQIADVSPERLQQYFVPVEGGHQVCKAVRESCIFARQNLISDPPFSRLDLVMCRNVLIYLGTTLQKRLLPTFHYGLKSTGFLMLGTSETVGDFLDLFALVDKKNKIYSRKLASTRLNIDLIAHNYPLNIINPQPSKREDAQSELEIQKEADRLVLNQYAPVGVVINTDLEILQFRGQTSPYLEPAPGKASLNLLKMAKAPLRLELRTAIHQAKKQGLAVRKEGIRIEENDQIRHVRVSVIPLNAPVIVEGYLLVLFEDMSLSLPTRSSSSNRSAQSQPEQSASNEPEVSRLGQELAITKDHLQSIIEEQQATNQDLRAANEEILSSNEELQSTNEELETAKEEIQAANEELNTINDELHRRNIESTHLSNDLQNLLSNINIPILMLGSDLRIRRFTPAVEGIFNLISTDVGRPLSDINHNLNVPDLEQQILEVIRNLNLKVQEIQDQQGRWYDMRIRPYRTSENKIDGAVLVLVEIDTLKRSAQQLKASRDYAEAIVETMRQPLVVLDTGLRVLTANRAFYETFQVIPATTQQQLIFDLGNGQWDIPQLRSLLEEVLPSDIERQHFQDFEVEHDFDHIGRKIMLLNARKMRQAEQQEMVLLAIEDITEQKRLKAELTQTLAQEQSARTTAEAANRVKDEFLSVLSHELRNPLSSLLGWIQLLRRQHLNEAKTAQALEAIERSARSQAQLIEDLLDVSRITSGMLRLRARLIDLAPLIQAAIDVVSVSADAKQIQIVSRLSPATGQISGDPVRLQQIIWNLLSNAIKFTPKGGRVEVTLEYLDSQAQIQVSDTGMGISVSFLPYVFDRFRQADSSQTRSNSGLGLGLSIVRQLVELHGGTVYVESPGEGQGATFTVRLPQRTDIERDTPVYTLESVDPTHDPVILVDEAPSLEGLRVLVVDDEVDNRELFITILEHYGASVTGVTSARVALSTLTASPQEYDVLLSDISMPDEDGYALIRRVRALSAEAGGKIPAAALTAHARIEDQTAAIAAGFQMHLAKPINPTQLVLVVANLVGRISR